MTDIEQTLHPHLRSGERILWSGRPSALPLARSYRKYSWVGLHIFIIPIFIFMMMYDTNNGPEEILRMPARFLVISVLGALLMIWPRWKARRASRVAYAVTDRRILIAEGKSARSFRPDALSVILRRDRGNGVGDLTFGERTDQSPPRPSGWFTSDYEHDLSHKAGFFGVKDIEGAETAAFTLKNASS